VLINSSSIAVHCTKTVAFPVQLLLPVSNQEGILINRINTSFLQSLQVKFRQFGAGFMCALPDRLEIDLHPQLCTRISSQLRAEQEDNLQPTHTGKTTLICWETLNRFANWREFSKSQVIQLHPNYIKESRRVVSLREDCYI